MVDNSVSDIEVMDAATRFLEESDAQTAMGDIFVQYKGSIPADRAFKINSLHSSKIVDTEGNIAPIETSDLVVGVMLGLIEQSKLTKEDWPNPRIFELCMKVGWLLGSRAERDRILRSASESAKQTADGVMIPGKWVESEQNRATNGFATGR